MELTKKEVCLQNEVFAYYNGLGGLELHYIDYGIEDYVYCVSGTWGNNKSYHKLKIYYDDYSDYVKLYGYKVRLNECIRTNL